MDNLTNKKKVIKLYLKDFSFIYMIVQLIKNLIN